MFAMTSGTVRRVLHSRLYGFAVHVLQKSFGDLLVARSAGRCHIPTAHFRVLVTCRQDLMAAVAVCAGCSIFSLHHRTTVCALQILFHGMQYRNLVSRQKTRIGVAPRITSLPVSALPRSIHARCQWHDEQAFLLTYKSAPAV